MSIDLDLRCLIILLAIPDAVELSVFIGVGSWGYLNSPNVVLKITASCPFTNTPPISASIADAITFFMIEHTACRDPFGGGSCISDFMLSLEAELR